jgi:hypothetical protein
LADVVGDVLEVFFGCVDELGQRAVVGGLVPNFLSAL